MALAHRALAALSIASLCLPCAACTSAIRPGGSDLLARLTGEASGKTAKAEQKPATVTAKAPVKPSAEVGAVPKFAADSPQKMSIIPASYVTLGSKTFAPPRTPGQGIADSMTLDQVIQATVGVHPLLRSRQFEIDVAEAGVIGASLWPNPQLVLDEETPLNEAGPTEITSRVMFTIPLGGKIMYGTMAADRAVQKARFTLSRETEVIIGGVVEAALEVLYLQELVSLQEELVQLSAQSAEEVNRGVDSGKSPVSAGAIADVRTASDEFDRLDSDAKLRGARIRLSRAMGLSPPRQIEVSGRLTAELFPNVPIEAVLAAVRENRPELAEARAAIEQSRGELALAHAEAIPDLEFGPRFRDRFRDPSDTLGARVQIDLPLFNRNQGGIAEKEAEIRMNQANYQLAEMTTLNDVAEAHAELIRLKLKLEHTERRVLPLISTATQAVKDSYLAGKIDPHQLTNELERLAKLRINHLDLRYRYNQLRAKIELYTGRSLLQMAGPPGAPDAFQDEPLPSPTTPAPSRPRMAPSAPKTTPEPTTPMDMPPANETPGVTMPDLEQPAPDSEARDGPATRSALNSRGGRNYAGTPRGTYSAIGNGAVQPASGVEPARTPHSGLPALTPPAQANETSENLEKIDGLDLISP